MTSAYSELHLKSFYSFGLGASHAHELLARAKENGYDSLALTDTNLCGALEFARLAVSLGIRPITGGELTLADGTRLVLLAMTRRGYGNLSRLFTLANAVDRREPRLDTEHLAHHAEGLVLLAGGQGRATCQSCCWRVDAREAGYPTERLYGVVRAKTRSMWNFSATTCRVTPSSHGPRWGWPWTWVLQ